MSALLGRLVNKYTPGPMPTPVDEIIQIVTRSTLKWIMSKTAKPLIEHDVLQRIHLLHVDTVLE